jgi:hypothetical protein
MNVIELPVYSRMKSDLFFDETSKIAYNQLTKNSSVQSRVMLNIEQFEIGSRYVTAKVQNRYGEKVSINIQGGRLGIELQESFFKIKEEKRERIPSYAYLITRLIQDNRILARKLPLLKWRKEKATEMLNDAGFTNIEVKRLPHDFQNYYYIPYKNK